MTKRTDKESKEIRDLVAEYIRRNNDVPATLFMQEYLEAFNFYGVSSGTITAIYRELGYSPKRQPSFVWKHKGTHE